MNKLNRSQLKEILEMKDLTVKDAIEKISKHSELKFLLTTAGIWLIVRYVLAVVVGGNLLYVLYRIFHLVLG